MLYPHNEQVYNNLINNFNKKNVCIVMGTGVGKSYVTLEYVQSFGLRPLIVAPRNEICKSWKKLIKDCDTITYQKLARIYKEIDYSVYDVVICDEVHHIGADTWGKPIQKLINDGIIRVIGLTEDPVRWTDGARNVCDEFFSGNIIRGKDVSSAISEGILNPVTYIGAFYNSDGLRDELRGKIQDKLYAKLDLVLNQTPTVSEILSSNMPEGDRKGIIFAQTIEDMKDAESFVHSVFPDVEIRFVYSKQSNAINNRNFEWFKKVSSGYLCSVDMISEGVHIKGVNTLIMLRRTQSLNLFNQQIGRCLDAGANKSPAIIFDLVNNKGNVEIINGKPRIKVNSVFQNSVLSSSPSEQKIIKDYSKDLTDILLEVKESFDNDWSDAEEKLLRDFYKKHPNGRGLKEFVKKYLPKRTHAGAKGKAKVLGLNQEWVSVPWSKEEDEILFSYYPTEGSNCYKRLPEYRDKESVHLRASKLNIKAPVNLWKPEDDEVLYKIYPTQGAEAVSKILNRSVRSIRGRACVLGIKYVGKENWTETEDKIIRELYPTHTSMELETLLPGRTAIKIRRRAKALGVRRETDVMKVRCIETGEVFNNAVDAVKKMNLSDSLNASNNITKCCFHKKGTAYGYHWEYVHDKNS